MTDATELADLYTTYKQLTSAFAAAVIAGDPDSELRDAAVRLHRRSSRAVDVHPDGPFRIDDGLYLAEISLRAEDRSRSQAARGQTV